MQCGSGQSGCGEERRAPGEVRRPGPFFPGILLLQSRTHLRRGASGDQGGEYNQPRATEEAVYQQIIEDLTYAAEHLPTRQEWGAKESGRATKGTAEGLLAKVYLFRQDYANVKKYTGQVIARGEYSLHRDYRDLFNPNSYYSDEVMLADQYLWGESTERNLESEYVKWQGIRGEMGMFSPSEALDQAYEAGDPRRTATIFYDGETLEGKGEIHFKKEVPPRANKKTIWPTGYWNENSFAKQNCHLIFLRYADVLLMYAEACNELGESREALDKLEMVRARARRTVHPADMTVGLPEITETGKEKLREIIWNERRIELATEGQRYFDVRRWMIADQEGEGRQYGYVHGMNMNGTEDKFLQEVEASPIVFRRKMYLYPIPDSEMKKSDGQLVQNPGW